MQTAICNLLIDGAEFHDGFTECCAELYVEEFCFCFVGGFDFLVDVE